MSISFENVAGRHYLTKADLNALYFARYQLPRPRGWKQKFTVGNYWRAALVVFFNYSVNTGTVFKSASFHDPILWPRRHPNWLRERNPRGEWSLPSTRTKSGSWISRRFPREHCRD